LLVIGQDSFAQLTHHCAVLRVAMEGAWKKRAQSHPADEAAPAGVAAAGNGR